MLPKPLSPLDQMFLLLERRNQPMHVGSLQLLRPPADTPANWLALQVEQLRQSTVAVPPFNLRLNRQLRGWLWNEDEQFDLEAHFRHLALPAPGRIRELLALVSQLHSAPLDRGKPLWELYVISGIEGGRFAIYSKIHHALVDGVAAMRLLRKTMSEDPAGSLIPPWTLSRRSGSERSSSAQVALTGLAKVLAGARSQAATIPTVTRELYRSLREARDNPDYVSYYQAPRCIFNQRITGSRRFAAQSYSLTRIRAVVKQRHVTVNDVVLAMCASALRKYLMDLEALPLKPLIAMVPLSLRRDDSDEGNQIGMILANLGTHLADPVQRLATIQGSVQDAKRRYARMGAAAMMNYIATVMAPAGLNIATGIAPRWQSFNVIISNVPGPKRPLYWNGAPLEGMYPVSVITDGLALNITLTSYVDRLEFGITACRRTLPRIQRLLDYLEQGLVELENAAISDSQTVVAVREKTTARARKTAPRSKTA